MKINRILIFIIVSVFFDFCNWTVQLQDLPEPVIEPYVPTWNRWYGLDEIINPRVIIDNVHILPRSVVYSDGKLYMYYSGYNGTVYRIGRAFSNNGKTFERSGLVLDRGGENDFDSDGVRDPSVVYDSDNKKFYMWYTGIKDGISRIGLAESTGGISWEKKGIVLQAGLSGEFDDNMVFAPSVIKQGNLFIMYYSAYDGSVYSVGLAESYDGQNWEKKGAIIVPEIGTFYEDGILYPSIMFDGYKYVLWFTGMQSGKSVIGKAMSENRLMNWVIQSAEFLDVGAVDTTDDENLISTAVYYDNEYQYFLYYGGDNGSNITVHLADCYASDTLTDCNAESTWNKQGMILNVQSGSEIDSLYAFNPSTIFNSDDSQYYMQYTAYDGSVFTKALATSYNRINWSRKGELVGLKVSGEFDEKEVSSSSLLYEENKIKMYYIARDASDQYSIGYAESLYDPNCESNCTTFGLDYNNRKLLFVPDGIYDSDGYLDISVLKKGDINYIFLLTQQASQRYLVYRTTNDNISFDSLKVVQLPVSVNLSDINNIEMIYYIDKWFFYFTQLKDGNLGLYEMHSENLVDWSDVSKILVPQRNFESSGIESFGITKKSSDCLLDMWYTGYSGEYKAIGYACYK